MKTLKIVSLDISFRNLGIAVGTMDCDTGLLTVNHINTVHTVPNPNKKVPNSTWDISQAKLLYTAIQGYTLDADVVCIEVPYGSQDVKAAVGRGICLGLLSTIQCPNIFLVTPQSVKKVLGNPKATKKDSVAWASTTHPEAPWHKHRGRITTDANEHSADAIAAIYAAASQHNFKALKETSYAN